MNYKIFFLLFCLSFSLFSQQEDEEIETYVDEDYLEDQLYFGIQYNFITNATSSIDNTGVPFSIGAGFIKDIPLNKKRNKGIGLGVGYSFDVVRPNIAITETNDNLTYHIDNNYSRYDYTSHNLEIPLEFRWRTSTPTNDSFWRIYTGFSFIYNLQNSASFDDEDGITTEFSDLSTVNSTNYTVYTSIGFGTWNFHVKYYINPFFKDNTISDSGNNLSFNQLKLGVMFYIL